MALQFILPLRRILPLLLPLRIGAAQRALLGDDLTADGLRGMDLTYDALIAQRLLRRDHERLRGKAPARAAPDGEAAGALRERTEPRAGAVGDVDPPDLAVGVGIELDRDAVRVVGGGS